MRAGGVLNLRQRQRTRVLVLLVANGVAAATGLVGSPSSEAGHPTTVRSTATAKATSDDCGARVLKADGTRWRCSFVDNFGGRKLDAAKWIAQETALTGITNGFGACYVGDASTIQVANGSLKLTALRTDSFVCKSPFRKFSTEYAAAAVTTRGRFNQAYGRFAFRVKMPTTRVAGAHSALWLNPNDNTYGTWPRSGEVDVAEWYSAKPRQVYPAVHYVDGADDVHTGDGTTIQNVSNFHTYALEWSPTTMSFFFDNRLVWEHTWDPAAPLHSPQPFDQPFNVVLSQVWGGLWNAPTDATPRRNVLVVDWVKVWR